MSTFVEVSGNGSKLVVVELLELLDELLE